MFIFNIVAPFLNHQAIRMSCMALNIKETDTNIRRNLKREYEEQVMRCVIFKVSKIAVLCVLILCLYTPRIMRHFLIL